MPQREEELTPAPMDQLQKPEAADVSEFLTTEVSWASSMDTVLRFHFFETAKGMCGRHFGTEGTEQPRFPLGSVQHWRTREKFGV